MSDEVTDDASNMELTEQLEIWDIGQMDSSEETLDSSVLDQSEMETNWAILAIRVKRCEKNEGTTIG